ncbi:hypothetical protein VRU48_04465 [Pedobacter sp. KR3-3]|uniref:Outer membrane protein beta-barrel domain-containing protein n=1 Tax=Pedobacter albus TaxID=3113905 RepID=A0ABU7I4J9_9SPHI|nr:hypothetical protein [Pedobacter sp. KR3-3]MEE1944348.1 hypothetical protein [Pedobacter sp. KR3-3]
MKKYIMAIACSLLACITATLKAQDSPTRQDKLYSMSGIGFSFPVGESTDYLKPKFSTSLGLNLGLGNKGLFLYPKVSLHAYGYQELNPDEGYTHSLKKARTTTYLLNLALGYRHINGKFAWYGFAGGGGGIILTPRVTIDQSGHLATLDNKSNGMGMIEAGLGTEYNIGGASLFIEASYMQGFSKIQNRSFSAVPLTVGIKPNLSKLFNKKNK